MSARAGVNRGVRRLSERVGFGGILGQVWFAGTNVTQIKAGVVPDGAGFAFVEALGRGGTAETSGNGAARAAGGGGAGNDAIASVVPGKSFTIDASQTNVSATTIKIDGIVVLSANSAPVGRNGIGDAATGKYPGTRGSHTDVTGGNGGGRFAGTGGRTGFNNGPSPGLGSGDYSTQNGQLLAGGHGAGCVTFFASYDEAEAFAKAVYGGSWTP